MSYKVDTHCPFAYSLEIFGDKWTLLILRQLLACKNRYYDEFIGGIEEGISTNILASRLRDMVTNGLLSKRKDPENQARWIYEPTQKSLDLIPLLIEMGIWASKHDPQTGVPPDVAEKMKNNKQTFVNDWAKPFERLLDN